MRLAGWASVLNRSVRDLLASDGLVWAAALAFYSLLSFFPLVILIIIVSSYVTDPAWVTERLVNGVNEFIPAEQIDPAALLAGAQQERQRLGIIAVIVVLLAGRRVLGTLVLAMDRMSDVDRRDDSFRRRTLIEILLVLGVAAVAALALLTRPAIALVEQAVGFSPADDDRVTLLVVEASQVLLIFATITLVYAVVPHGKRMWPAVLTASGSATALFLATRAVFTAIVDLLWESLATLYGPLATAAFLLTWVYWVALIVLFGASLSSHIKVMSLEGASVQETEQRHVARTNDPGTPRSPNRPPDPSTPTHTHTHTPIPVRRNGQ